MFFSNLDSVIRVLVAALLAYTSLVLVLRLAGKRALAKMHAFDFAVTVAIGSTLATVLLSKDVAIVEGILAFVVLATLQWIVSRMSLAWKPFRNAVRSGPRLLVRDGCYCRQAMRDERILQSEVDMAIRASGIGQLEKVAAVVLEADGSMSVVQGQCADIDVMGDVRR